ncbi:hypothetical protein FQN52_004687 [Onygenales sp. PD_12]|nr:hypothetical protein FQN52_004687 [Onygenales sp. PD_12]
MARLSSAISSTSTSSPPSSSSSPDATVSSTPADQHLLTPATSHSQSETSSTVAMEAECGGSGSSNIEEDGGGEGKEVGDGARVVEGRRGGLRRVTRSSMGGDKGVGVKGVRDEGVYGDERVTRHPLRSNPLGVEEGVGVGVGGDVKEGDNGNENENENENGDQDGLEKGGQEKADGMGKGENENTKPTARRRSSRLVLLEKTTEIVDKASTVLGKRSREAMALMKRKDKLQILNRRASLRPRNAPVADAPATTTAASTTDGPAAKKRRVSAGDAVQSSPATPPVQEKPKTAPYKRKRWLSHGLFAGQDRYFDPRMTEEKNRIKFAKKNADERNKLFPLPMFAGERLMQDGRDFKLPFDIFSPLPPGQPKPDEWRKTNKNVFVGDAASIWKAAKLGECSTCMCTPETGCDENCQNGYMFYECDDNNCKLGAELCGNRSFEGLRQRTKAGGKYNIGVEVIKTADRGYGVRSNRAFAPNQIIVEYTGEIITQEECERRMRSLYKDNECYYLMYFDQNMIIDATRGSIARFVNHSCEPNCKMEKWTVAGKPRMALFAGENGIMTGEELTYDYNFDPYSQKNVQECRCGAPNCRGVLGPKPKDQGRSRSDNNSKQTKATKKRSSTAGTKRKQDTVLDESSTSRLNKRRKLLKPASGKLKAGLKKAVASARSATSLTRKGKGKGNSNAAGNARASAKTKTATATTAKSRAKPKPKPRPAPIKKTKVRPRPAAAKAKKTTAAARKTTTATPRKQAQAQPQTTQPENTKLNRPTKRKIGNSIAAARTASSKTPAAMRKFLQAGKSAAKGTTAKASKQTSSAKKAQAAGWSGGRKGVQKTVKRVVGAVRGGKKGD